MTFDDYMEWTDKTANYPNVNEGNYIYPALGLGGESGEVLEKIKKLQRDKGGVIDKKFIMDISGEIGDVLYYLARLCKEFNISFDDIVQYNIKKLESRLERGKIQGDGDNR